MYFMLIMIIDLTMATLKLANYTKISNTVLNNNNDLSDFSTIT